MKNGIKKKHVIIFLIITILSIVRICYLYIETSKIETIYFKNKDIINTVDGNYIQLIKYEIIDSWEDEMVDNEEYNKEIKEMVDHNFIIKLTYKTNSKIFKENDFYKFNKNGASVFLGYTNDVDESFEVFVFARQKAREIAMLKYRIQEQKRVLSRSIEDIKSQNESIQQEIAKNQDMIQRLRTDRRTYENAENDLARQSNSLQSMIERRQSTTTYTSSNIKVSTGFIKPINGRITSPFGWRVHPIFRSRSFHSGVDIAGPYRGNVRAANSGRVIYASWYGGYGKVVILDHGRVNGVPTTTLYAHLNSWNVSAGQYVSKGQVIGFEGTTGYSTGPHVHFEVRLNGRPHNPLNYI